jgi:hypothetical protein
MCLWKAGRLLIKPDARYVAEARKNVKGTSKNSDHREFVRI